MTKPSLYNTSLALAGLVAIAIMVGLASKPEAGPATAQDTRWQNLGMATYRCHQGRALYRNYGGQGAITVVPNAAECVVRRD